MRRTVDEKLQGTLDRRLGESFKQVNDGLEQVHKGLGEMQTLAAAAGDLKRVLTNVKTRGSWGEVQLGNLLDHILTADQYARNVKTKASASGTVEYALRLPGPMDETGNTIDAAAQRSRQIEKKLRKVEALPAAEAAALLPESSSPDDADEVVPAELFRLSASQHLKADYINLVDGRLSGKEKAVRPREFWGRCC
jgi:DNA recombination protein RmuC